MRRPFFEALEPRWLLSADLPGLAIPIDGTHVTAVSAVQEAPAAQRQEIAFIDGGLPGAAALARDMEAGTPERHLEVVVLDPSADGFAQVSAELEKRQGLDAVHLIGHGTDGSITLGTSLLDAGEATRRAATLVRWHNALKADADILIYGCRSAYGIGGETLLQTLADLTGADVAGSVDATGARDLGGNWVLERQTGRVDAALALSLRMQQSYSALLDGAAGGSETRANSSTTNTQSLQAGSQKQVAVAADGSFVVVWSSDHVSSGNAEIYARRFNADGTAATGEILVNQTTTGTQDSPAVACDASGNFVVMWQGPDANATGTFARRFSSAGTALGGEFQVNTTTFGDQREGAIAMAADGRFAIGWSDEGGLDGSGAGAYVRLYNAAGTAQTGEIRVNVVTAGSQYIDSIAMTSSGSFIVSGSGANIDGSGMAAFFRRFDGAGTALDATDQIANTTTTGDQSYVSVATAPDGRFTVTWSSADASGLGVYAQRYNADGTKFGAEFRVNTTTAGDQHRSAVAMDRNARIVVTWDSFGQDAAGTTGSYRQEYNWDGTANGAEVRVNATTAGNQGNASVAMNALGQYVVAWTGNGTSDGSGVFFQRYSTALVVDTTSDVADGTTTSIAALLANRGADGRISLREAILAANSTANVGGADRIFFSIAGAGPHTINVSAGGLPNITGAVVIDGTSEPDFAGTPMVELNGSGAGASSSGLVLDSGSAGSTIRGFVVNRFGASAIRILGSSNNTVAGNFLGTNAAGTAALGNQVGVFVTSSSTNNVIGGAAVADRNVISGNTVDGLQIWGAGTSGNVVRGNIIGLDLTGTVDLGNTNQGVAIFSGATNNWVGGTAAGEGNVISGNDGDGVTVTINASTGNRILGNSIYGNGGLGIDLANDGVTVNDGATGSAPNQGMDTAVITGALLGGSNLALTGYVGNVPSSATFGNVRVEFFRAAPDASGRGEGQSYLGTLTTNATSQFSGTIAVTGLAAGDGITATATDAAGNTSEFALNFTVTSSAPVASNDSYSVNEDATLTVGPSSTGLVNWYRMDDGGVSQTVADSGSLANDGTRGSTTSANSDDPAWNTITPNIGAAALTFDGTSDYVSTPSTVARTSSSFTLSAWFKTTTTAGQQHILWEGYSGGNGYGDPGFNSPASSEMSLSVGTYNQADKIAFFLGYDVPGGGANPIYIVSASNFTDTTQWHHVAVTVDLGASTPTGSLYVDGVLEGTDTGVQNDRSQWGSLQIGKPGAASRYFSGGIDEVRVYDTALSGAQVQAIAQSGVLQNDTDPNNDPMTAVLVAGPSNASAFTLNADGTFSYTPAANFAGTDTFTYRANDGTNNSAVTTVTITVNGVNDAPVLDDTKSPALAIQTANAGAPSGAVGTLVSTLVDLAAPSGQVDNVAEVDSSPSLGIAVTAADVTNGSWFYSTNNGANWLALTAVTNTSARLLAADASTRLYFQPNTNYSGTLAGAITFRAWDQSSGSNGALVSTAANGGSTAFSTTTDTASLVVKKAATITAIETADLNNNGFIDAVRVVFSEAILDSTVIANDFDVAGVTGEAFSSTTNSDTANDADIYITFADGVLDTGAKPIVTYTQDSPTDADVTDALGVKLANFGNWWNASWLNRTQITFDNTGSTTNLTNYPVLVSLDSSKVDFAKIKAGGADIRFVDSDGTTVLDYEIEAWDDVGETASVWVLVPQVNLSSNTDFVHLYYNNAVATDAQNAAGVWAAGIGVWHLANDPGPGGAGDIKDADASPLNGTADASMTSADLVAGRIGNAINFDGTVGFIDFTTATDVGNTFTISAWIRPDSTGTSVIKTIAANSASGNATDGFRLFMNSNLTNDRSIRFETGNGAAGNSASTAAGAVTFDQWNHVAVTVNRAGGTARIYVNGVDATVDNTIRNDFNTSSDWEIGRMEGNLWFDGAIDEFQIADVARSADWIEASYRSQNGTFTFNAFGREEAATTDRAAPVLLSATSPQSTGANLFQGVGQQLDLRFSESLSAAASEVNLEAALTFAAGATDGDNLPTIGAGANPISLVTTTRTNDTLRVTFNTNNAANADWLRVGTHTARVSLGTNLIDTAGNTANIAAAAVTITGNTNTAPVLDNTKSPALTAQNEDAGAPSGAVGTLVSSLVDFATPSGQVDNVTDANIVPVSGIAVTAADTANGAWYYTTNGGTNWIALGTPSAASSRLLAADASTRLCFQPNANYNGTLAAAITFRAWDQTSGSNGALASTAANGGTTAFSTATDTASLVVTAVTDTPSTTAATTNEDTQSASGLVISRNAADGTEVTHFKITAITNGVLYKNDGTTQITSGTFITFAEGNAGLKFTPTADFNGTGSFTIQASTANVDAGLGGSTVGATITVNAVNDTPTGADKTVAINEDTAYTFSAADFGFADVDSGDTLSAVRIDALPGVGTLRLSGVVVTALQVITAANIPNLVFTPAANANGTGYASFTFSVRDQSLAYDTAPNTITVNVTALSDPPTGTDKTVTTNEDTAYTFSAADFGFSDVDAGDTLSAVRIDALPGAGTLRLSGVLVTASQVITAANIPNLLFTPAANVNGAGYASFTFSARDQSLAYDTTPNTITVNVSAVNDAPTGADKTITTNEDTAYTFSAADFGFSDVDAGDTLSAVRIDTLPGAGTLTLSGGAVTAAQVITAIDIPNLVFTPAANANGTGYTSFNFSLRDQSLAYDAAPNTIIVNVSAVNDVPTATNLSATETYTEDAPLNLIDIVIADVDSANVTATLTLSSAAAGSLSTSTSGAVTSTFSGGVWSASGAVADVNMLLAGLSFIPATNFDSSFSITTSVSDGVAAAVTGNKGMTAVAVNDAPTASDDTASTDPGIALDVNVKANDGDVDNTVGSLVVTIIGNSAGTTATVNGDNSIHFDPGLTTGAQTVTYRLSDSSLNSNIATLTVNVAANTPPDSANASVTFNEDSSYVLQGGDFTFSDADIGQTQGGVRVDTLPVNGALLLNGIAVAASDVVSIGDINANRLVFTPAANGNGAPYTSFTFSVQDNFGGFDTTPNTFVLNVTPVNDAPTTSAVTLAAIAEDSGVRLITQAELLANASDLDGPSLTATGLVIASGGGALVDNGNGTWNYTPGANDDTAVSFGYSITDGTDSVAGTANLDITAVNDAPTTSAVTLAAIAEDSGVRLITQAELLANASDLDGPSLTATGLAIASGSGTLVDNGNGTWNYTPGANDDTAVSFGYSITDGTDSVAGTANLDITAVNDAPTTSAVTLAAIAEDSGVRLITQAELLANASDLDGPSLTATGLVIASGGGALVDNGNGTWNYTPGANDDTAVSFGYSITDGTDSVAGTANLDITAVNDAPTTSAVTLAAIAEDSGVRLITQAELLANASDLDGPSLTATGLAIASGSGTLVDNGNGTWTYTPVLNDDTSVSFTYTVTDGAAPVAATASLDITAVNDAPTTSAVTLAAIAEDSGVRLITQAELLANASDLDGPSLTATGLVIASGGGALVDNGNGTWNYTPGANDDTAVSFGYSITDGTDSVAGTANLDITAVNDAPTTSAVTLAAIAEDSGVRLITQAELLANASDLDGPSLTATGLAIASGSGTLVDNGNGTWNYTPVLNDDTSVSFTYTVTDGAAPVAATASLDITAVNDAPTTSAVTLAAIAEDSGVRLITQAELLANASDLDGPSLTATGLVIASGGGALVDNGNGTWNYTPVLNDDTSISFAYTVTDGAASAAATASLDITPVDDAPSLPTATLSVAQGGATTIIGTSFPVTDPDGPAPVFTVQNVVGGYFESVTAPGTPILSFTAAQLASGQIRFVHTGGATVPSFQVSASDGTSSTLFINATVSFAPTSVAPAEPGILTPPPIIIIEAPAISGGGNSSTTAALVAAAQSPRTILQATVPPFAVPRKPAAPTPAPQPESGGGVPGPVAENANRGTDEKTSLGNVAFTLPAVTLPPVNVPAATGLAEPDLPLAARAQLIAELSGVLEDEPEPTRLELALKSAQLASLALSVGVVTWILRAGGLISSLLASLPAWRHMDPLPILARDKEEEEEEEEEARKRRKLAEEQDEKKVGRVLAQV